MYSMQLAANAEDVSYMRDYYRIKRQNKRINKRAMKLFSITRIMFATMLLLIAIVVAFGIYSVNKIQALTNQVVTLQQSNMKLQEENKTLNKAYTNTYNALQQLSTADVKLNKEVTTLTASNKSLTTKVQSYEAREELFDDYEWAKIRSDGTKTDITYSDIENLQQLCKEQGMTDETISLVLSIAMVESDGTETAKNTSSTATGLGGFLQGTGKFVYTKLMGNNTYSHSAVATDGTTNLEMMVYYLKYLDQKDNGNIGEVINNYRGVSDKSYKYKLNSYLANNGLTLAGLKLLQ